LDDFYHAGLNTSGVHATSVVLSYSIAVHNAPATIHPL